MAARSKNRIEPFDSLQNWSAMYKPTKTGCFQAGSKIVDLFELAKQMYCKECTRLLNLNNVLVETSIGFSSQLAILCVCGNTNAVYTSKCVGFDDGFPRLRSNVNVLSTIGKKVFVLFVAAF